MSVNNKIFIGGKYFMGLILLLTLASCSTVQIGKDFDIHAFDSKAVVGETKKAHVHNWLGKPKSTGITQNENGERLEEWVYFYATGQLPSMSDADMKILEIRFDKNGVLRSFNWSGSK